MALRPLFCLFLSGCLRQVSLYYTYLLYMYLCMYLPCKSVSVSYPGQLESTVACEIILPN